MSPIDYSIWGWSEIKLAGYREENEIKNEADLTTAPIYRDSQIPQSLVDKEVDWHSHCSWRRAVRAQKKRTKKEE